MTKRTLGPELLCNRCGETRPAAVSPARWKKITEGKDTFLCKECVDEAVETGVYDIDFIKERRPLRGKPNAPIKWEYLLKWKGFDEAQSSWESEDSLAFCEEAKREFDRQQDKKALEHGQDPKSTTALNRVNKAGELSNVKRKRSPGVVCAQDELQAYEAAVRAKLGQNYYDEMVSQLNSCMTQQLPGGISKSQELMCKRAFINFFVKAVEEADSGHNGS